MTRASTTLRRCLAAGLVVVGLAACGETPQVNQAAASPLTAATVAVRQTGDAAITIKDGSITWHLDDARLLQVGMVVHSTAARAQTVSLRASIYDAGGRLIGDAAGGTLNVKPRSDAQITLTGPAPNGTIASATFEIRTTASPT